MRCPERENRSGRRKWKGCGWTGIVRCYYPLALTALLALAVHPLATFFREKPPSRGVPGCAPRHQRLSIHFSKRNSVLSRSGDRPAGRFPKKLSHGTQFWVSAGGILLGPLLLLAFTPLLDWWYRTVSGLTPALSRLAEVPTRIRVGMPVLTLWIAFQRAILVVARKTLPMTLASLLEIVGLALVLWLTIYHLNLIGIVAAAAFVRGRLPANLYLYRPGKKLLNLILRPNRKVRAWD